MKFNSALLLTIGRSSISLIPTALAFLLFQGSHEKLIEFLKIQTIFSLLATISTLGLGGYIYINLADKNRNLEDKRIFFNLLRVVIYTTILVTLSIPAVYYYNFISRKELFIVMSLTPIAAITAIGLQIALGKKLNIIATAILTINPLIFTVYALVLHFYIDYVANYILSLILLILSIYFLLSNKKYMSKLILAKKNQSKLIILFLKQNYLIILNGIISSASPPLITLIILYSEKDFANFSNNFSLYLFYTRVLDSALGLIMTYFIASTFHNIKLGWNFFNIKTFIGLILLCFVIYIPLNIISYFINNRYSLSISSIEVITFIFKIIISVLTLLMLKKFSKVIIFKDLILAISLYILLHHVKISSIQDFQFLIALLYFIAMLGISYFYIYNNKLNEKNYS